MRSRTLRITAICVASITAACRPATRPSPSALPEQHEAFEPKDIKTRQLQFSSSIYRYHLEQATQIIASESADTIPSTITTRARILVSVAVEPNSDVEVSISFDSISISTDGSIPSPGLKQVASLDSILLARFSVTEIGTTVETRLADSLCAYSQFIVAAQEVLLPELALRIETPGTRVHVDTGTHKACRGGITLELITVRELRDLSREPPEFMLQQQTQIGGSGQLRRDSMTISGSILTRGTATFATANRLPSLIQTTSEGTINVQLGTLTTTFRQISQQQIRLVGIGNP